MLESGPGRKAAAPGVGAAGPGTALDPATLPKGAYCPAFTLWSRVLQVLEMSWRVMIWKKNWHIDSKGKTAVYQGAEGVEPSLESQLTGARNPMLRC